LAAALHKAGHLACRVNAKTNNAAVRALLNIPELQLRHQQARLKYVGKIMSMEKHRLARTVIMRGSPRRSVWWKTTMSLIAAHPALKEGFAKLQRSADRNHGVVPLGLDPTVDLDIEYSPLRTWRATVERWAAALNLKNFRKERGPTLALMQRAVKHPELQEAGEDIDRMPRFPLTRVANHGPNQIRLRLLSGTSALNSTLNKWTERKSTCPFDSCVGGKEDATHFLLHCEGVAELRTHYEGQLTTRCYCDPDDTCAKFYEGLNTAGKALFILGGPVDGRTPEVSIDACSREFVRLAWDARCTTLTAKNPDASVVDFTTPAQGRAHGIPGSHPSRGSGADGPITTQTSGQRGSNPYRRRRSLITAHLHPCTAPTAAPESPQKGRPAMHQTSIAQWTTTTTRANVSDSCNCHNGSGPNVLKDKGC